MSMSVDQRRTEVLRRVDLISGSVRLTKASSRYDRRYRYFAVELLRPTYCGHAYEEYLWRVLCDWPVGEPGAGAEARAYFTGACAAVRCL